MCSFMGILIDKKGMVINLQKKLMGTYLMIISLTIIIAIIFSWQKGNQHFKETVKKDTEIQGTLLTEILLREDENELIDFQHFVNKYSEISNFRITVIDMEGIVVADSHENYEIMDNHAHRQEVSQAMKGNIYSKIRYSKTLGTYYLYTALPLKLKTFEGVLRLSVPLNDIKELAYDMIKYVIYGIIIGAIIAILIAYFVTKKMMEPINEITKASIEVSEGNYNKKLYIKTKDEREKLAEAFNNMTIKLRLNMWKLEKRNREFESVLSSMINGVIAVDEEYNVFLYNKQAKKILDIKEEIDEKSIYEVIRNSTIFNVLETSISQNKYMVDETKLMSKSDKIIRVYANPIFSNTSSKRSLGTLLVIRDVTEIRKLETMRSDFVSNVTHELKTPLTSIRGFVDTLKNGAIKDEEIAIKFLDIIDIESERLSLLINDILSLSSIENSNKDINTINNVDNIINEVVDILYPKLRDKQLEIEVDIDKDIMFLCNKNRIKQLFINLLDNAIKYTEKGYVKIECRKDDSSLTIKVIDTGIGIAREHIERLFERFYRVDKGRSRKMGGTGLGLSIVKHIVELYNGTIQVQSEVGKGSTFIIRLPIS